MVKTENFNTLKIIPEDFIKDHGGTYSGEMDIGIRFVICLCLFTVTYEATFCVKRLVC